MKRIKSIISFVLAIVVAVFISNYEEHSAAVAAMQLPQVALSGESFGIKLHTAGVLVIATAEVQTDAGVKSPAKDLGLKSADVITEIDGKAVKSCAEVSDCIENSGGKTLIITYSRSGEKKSVALTPVRCSSGGTYKAGLWIRDSTAGIGTVTFYTAGGKFAALGHGVNDVDTGTLMPLDNGEALESEIIGFAPAQSGKAGELYGVLKPAIIGNITLNCEQGIYGTTQKRVDGKKLYETARKNQIKRGKAYIITTIDENTPRAYEAQIVYVSYFDTGNKDMIIKITDEALLQKTGGIIQGMSGSPIVQDGRFVGALTHVFLNKPALGYAVFGYKMVNLSAQ